MAKRKLHSLAPLQGAMMLLDPKLVVSATRLPDRLLSANLPGWPSLDLASETTACGTSNFGPWPLAFSLSDNAFPCPTR